MGHQEVEQCPDPGWGVGAVRGEGLDTELGASCPLEQELEATRRAHHLFRQAPVEAPVVADGFSCQHQITAGTERTGLHVARVVDAASA